MNFAALAIAAAIAGTSVPQIADTTAGGAAFANKDAGYIVLAAASKRSNVGVFKPRRARLNASNKLAGQQGNSAGPNNTFCGNADVFVWYEEDANGKPIPGTKQYGCTD